MRVGFVARNSKIAVDVKQNPPDLEMSQQWPFDCDFVRCDSFQGGCSPAENGRSCQ